MVFFWSNNRYNKEVEKIIILMEDIVVERESF